MTPETMDAASAAEHEAALGVALDAGRAVLDAGGTALEAVCAAVSVLEDDPHFNAGRGAGAEEFAREQGVEQVDPDWFATEARWQQLQELKAKKLGWFDAGLKYGTVGAVAVDASGHVAAATSTGGLTGKRWGRIGDSPLIGAGTYADDRAAAVSCTGSGEQFMRVGAAHEICARMRLGGEGPQAATEAVLDEVGVMGGVGGVIYATPGGKTGFAFTTPGMFRGRADSEGLREVGIFGN
jgi:beta-aspartyl-peptidase (threonine type)